MYQPINIRIYLKINQLMQVFTQNYGS